MTTGREKGFTLIEMLVATCVFSLLAVSLGVALKQGLETWRRVELDGRASRLARGLFSDLSRELRHAVSFPGKAVIVEKERLLFYTVRAPMPDAPEGGVFEVEYKLNHEAPMGSTAAGPFLEKSIRLLNASGGGDRVSAFLTQGPTEVLWDAPFSSGRVGEPTLWKAEWPLLSLPSGVRLRLSFPEEGKAFQAVFGIPGGRSAPLSEAKK